MLRTDTGHLAPSCLLNQRYRIICQIGEGGMGTVYKAVDTHLGNRLVAVKEMIGEKLNQRQSAEAITAFKREAHLLASLQHPHLPNIYEYFAEAGYWYLVMSFIDGQTLEDYFYISQKKNISIDEVLNISLQLCSVLEYLHAQNPPIIFRDLKPANIMRTANGHLYLIDFGIARHFKPWQAKDTVALGSPGYAAPEQYGKSQSSPRSDIYSFGATLHFLLTGNDPSLAPFQFAPLNQQSRAIPIELAALIQQMVAAHAADRPESVKIVKQKLQDIVTQQTTGRTKASPHAVISPSPVLSPLTTSIGTLLLTYRHHTDMVFTVAWSPDGRNVASGSKDGTARIWDCTTGNDVFVYRDHAQAVTFLEWSPDGKYIASGGYDRSIHIWEANTGKRLLSYEGHNISWASGTAIRALAWSPDGTYIASVSGDYTVQVWNAATGQRVLTYGGHQDSYPIRYVVWSPDGNYIASVAQDCNIWNVTTGRTLQRHQVGYSKVIAWSRDSLYIASVGGKTLIQKSVTMIPVNIWDIATGQKHLAYRGHTQPVTSVAWAYDGRKIASADRDVHIWDATTGERICVCRGHSDLISSLAWSPDSTCVASSSFDTTIQLWLVGAKL